MKRTDYMEGKTPAKEKYEEPTVGDTVSFAEERHGPKGEFMVISKKVFPAEGDHPRHVEIRLGGSGIDGYFVPEMLTHVRRSPWISVDDLMPESHEVVMVADNSMSYKSGIQKGQWLEEAGIWSLANGGRDYWNATHWMKLPPPPGQDRE